MADVDSAAALQRRAQTTVFCTAACKSSGVERHAVTRSEPAKDCYNTPV